VNNLNSILLEGNLVRDPLLRNVKTGTALCTFSIANNRYFKQGDETEKEVSYFDIETWSKLAESCANIGRKGRGCRIVGRLKQERWTDADGKARSRTVIVATNVEFRPDSGNKETTAAEPNNSAPQADFSDDIPF
jgi:single-strand DNA-binding protein